MKEFESLVNTEGSKTCVMRSSSAFLFESLVNTEGSKTQSATFTSPEKFESLVNTEVINKTEINQRES